MRHELYQFMRKIQGSNLLYQTFQSVLVSRKFFKRVVKKYTLNIRGNEIYFMSLGELPFIHVESLIID